MQTVRVDKRAWLVLMALFALAGPPAAAPVQPQIDEAQRRRALELNDVTGEDPIEGNVKSLVADPDGSRKLLATAVAMTKEKGKEQPFNYNAAYILARTADELKNLDAGRTFYRVCAQEARKLKSARKLSQAYGGLIFLLYENKKYDESEKVCKEVLEMTEEEEQSGISKSAVLQLMIRAIARQGKADQALKLANNYVKNHKDDWEAYELMAWVQRELGKVAESAKSYEALLERVSKDRNLNPEVRARRVESCHYILSNVYIDLNNVDKASEHLKILLAEKPDDPGYNNDLGYIWADHDMHLDEAEKMIRKALEEDRKQRKENAEAKGDEDKDNAAYLDSLGWVLFKKKKYQEAKEPLLKAVKDKEGQHIEILDHLGEVHMALGEKDEAIKAWKKGLEMAGDNKREQDRKAQVEKKLKAAQEK